MAQLSAAEARVAALTGSFDDLEEAVAGAARLAAEAIDHPAAPRAFDLDADPHEIPVREIAVALAGAFECGVNDLPLSMILSWYEQKACVILLSLLHLGIKDIRLGPSLPAFVSPHHPG